MDELLDIAYCLCVQVQDWMTAKARRVKRSLHGLRGHNDLLIFEHQHIYLECTVCHRQTRGWYCTISWQAGQAGDR